MFALVAPFKSSFDDVGITYHVPENIQELKVGQIVEVPLRSKSELGVVLEISEIAKFDDHQTDIRDIIAVKSQVCLPKAQIQLLQYIAHQYFVLIHASTALFFPKNLQEKLKKETLKYTTKKQKLYLSKSLDLTAAQSWALEKITSSKDATVLFWGVTGSGKTQIYMEIAKKMISEWKQVLILIPEIILSNQILERFQDFFGADIPLINSTLSDAKKTDAWMKIYSQDYSLIIGTRSALFYPYNNLWCIIIDEEHDQSYSSDNGPRYNARDIAKKLCELTGAKLILASGTPSVRSIYKATQKEYEMVSLLQKYNS